MRKFYKITSSGSSEIEKLKGLSVPRYRSLSYPSALFILSTTAIYI